ncbi:DUF2249 domain-containing protein [Puniceicoccales bacterium CK1056]|uniref:DUF2249 domain-containing protein n=1 Tax=Oceanipulchritudo coccoides TaxID=2706888 RepID=A0A6B2LYA0_9BACT|nr:DUF2249 domain-containing protein [Oceanipulchritudo coccoides]NDV61102.1 DUF2249 domain-containing protein [Oceanipulchritudo coccoides]
MKPDWIELDVRPTLAAGREPFALIMNSLDALESGQGLRLTAPFYPKPLVEMLKQQGWKTEERKLEGDDWEVQIRRGSEETSGAAVELDLRELAPPEPMVRILEALEVMESEKKLVALTPFYPENLLPLLKERGFQWEIERDRGQSCRITIHQA